MTNRARQKRKDMLRALWHQDRRCRFCGCVTRLLQVRRHQSEPPDRAVLLRLHTRLMASRHDRNDGKRRSELVCKKCADDYGNAIQRSMPIEVLRERAQRHPERKGRTSRPDSLT